MSVTKVIKLIVDVDSSDVKQLDKQLGGVESQIDKVTGGAVTKFRGLTKGVKGAITGFKGLRVAIISTGIGALLIAVTSLVSFFTKTQKGADLLSQAFKGVGAVVNVFIDRISLLGGALVKFFKGDFKGAFQDLGSAVSGVADEIEREVKAAVDLERQLQKLRDLEIGLIRTTAERRKEIAKNRLAAEDETLAIEKRVEALDKATEIEKKILEDELNIARQRAENIAAEVELSESTAEDIQKREEAAARVIELETRSLEFEKRIITRRNALVREGEAKRRQVLKEARDKILEDRKKDGGEVGGKLKRGDVTSLEGFATLEAEKTNVVAENAKLRNAIQQEAADEELRIRKIQQQQELAIVGQTFGQIAGILGENSAIGKAAAIAQATINTYQGVTEVLANKTTLPEPFGTINKVASIATILATGFQAVKDINSTQLPQGAPSVGGGGARGGASAPAFNVVGTSGVNQLADSLSQDTEPIQAFVVGSNVTSQQALDRNITETASLG